MDYYYEDIKNGIEHFSDSDDELDDVKNNNLEDIPNVPNVFQALSEILNPNIMNSIINNDSGSLQELLNSMIGNIMGELPGNTENAVNN